MAENENGQERTEEATAKRKEESRDKGEIARSKELTTLLLLLVSGAAFLSLGSGLIADIMEILRSHLTIERDLIFDETLYPQLFLNTLQDALNAVFPLFILLVIGALVAPLAMGGWTFSLKPLQPDFKKIDPIKGMSRIFSLKSLMELGKALFKFLLVGSMGYWLLQSNCLGKFW